MVKDAQGGQAGLAVWREGAAYWAGNQFSRYIYAKGGLMNDAERAYARKLLEMINSVDAEGSKVMDDLRNDVFKEIIKSIMKQ